VSDVEYRQVRFRRPPGACELLIVRHGESAPVRPGVPVPAVDGQDDPALDPVGVAQAERVADRLADEGISAVYVTNLQRTLQTAAPLLARLGVAPRVEPDLREVFLGEWEGGLMRQHARQGHPVAAQMGREQRWDVIPGAEPSDVFAGRVRDGINRVATAHPDETVAVFTHGGTIGQIMALASATTQPFAFNGCDNASISHVVVTPDRWIIRRFNDTAHLGMAFTTQGEPLI
jgi:2,3-bisphosphoglycerate-dependent phosphoglycerate mutase